MKQLKYKMFILRKINFQTL